MNNIGNRIISALAIIVCTACIFGAAWLHAMDIPYNGTALDGAPQLEHLRSQLYSVDEYARDQAQAKTGLPLDGDRLSLQLVDVPIGMTVFRTAMTASGHDTVTVSIRGQVWLRSAAKDSVELLKTLTHEYVHAILRQHMPAETYDLLPNWFQEGVAVHVADQHNDKLLDALGAKWRNPEGLYTDLANGSAGDDYLAGSWWFLAFEAMSGADATRALLGRLVVGGDLNESLNTFDCTVVDVWKHAEQLAAIEVLGATRGAGELLSDCLELQSEDPDECRKCLGRLISDHPDSYAAEFALYRAALLSYSQHYLQDAKDYMHRLSLGRRNFGMGDNILYRRIIMERDSNNIKTCRDLCREYFALWPDGNYYGRIQQIYREL